jgi:hypothetical protein
VGPPDNLNVWAGGHARATGSISDYSIVCLESESKLTKIFQPEKVGPDHVWGHVSNYTSMFGISASDLEMTI